jgi:hypothetical protein
MLAEKIKSNFISQMIKDKCILQVMYTKTHMHKGTYLNLKHKVRQYVLHFHQYTKCRGVAGMMFKFHVTVLISKRLTNVCMVPFVLCMQEISDPYNYHTNQ